MTTPTTSNVIRVKLVKQPRYGLGFLIRQRSKAPHVIVSDLVSGGMAAESGLVQIGDIILKVNGTDLIDKDYEDSVKLLKALPINSLVVLILKGPEGYTSHLETRFTNDGTPRTVRITKPILSADSFMDKIKKTFTSSSPKACRSKQTQVSCGCSSGTDSQNDVNTTSLNGSLPSKPIQNGNRSSVSTKENNQITINPSNLSLEGHGKDNHTIINDKIEQVNQNRTSKKLPALSNTLGDNTTDTVLNKAHCAENGTNKRYISKSKTDEKSLKLDSVLKGETCHLKTVPSDKRVLKVSSNKSPDSAVMTSTSDFVRQNGHGGCNNQSSNPLVNISLQNDDADHQLIYGNNSDSTDRITNGTDVTKKTVDSNRLSERRGSPTSRRRSSLKKFVKLRHVGEERPVCTDTLHQKAIEVSGTPFILNTVRMVDYMFPYVMV